MLYVCVFNFALIEAQVKDIGIPFIKNYTRQEYKGGPQNWGITQDDRGVLFFGNNQGLLEFDGNNWQLHPMLNMSIVRSVSKGYYNTQYYC